MIIKVKVFPGSGRQEIVEISDREYKVYLKKQAIEGKANMELVRLWKKYTGKHIKVIKGLKSRNKVIEIEE